jgi:hypothetical protein
LLPVGQAEKALTAIGADHSCGTQPSTPVTAALQTTLSDQK